MNTAAISQHSRQGRRSAHDTAAACEICGVTRQLDRHHVVSRGLGGSKDARINSDANLITLCRKCHGNVHEDGWHLERSAKLLRVVDQRTGKEVMRRLYASDFDPSSFFQALST